MSNFKWNDPNQERVLTNSKEINIVMFVSRNKDNKGIVGFKERRLSFPTTWDETDERLHERFKEFKQRGLEGETSRLYFSLNARDNKKVTRSLLHFVLDNQLELNPAGLSLLVTRIAMQKENASTKHRLFDFDSGDLKLLKEFISDLKSRGLSDTEVNVRETVNNYAVTIAHGVDLRGIVDTMPDLPVERKKDKGPWKWGSDIVTYKPDDLVLVDWGYKV